MDKDTKKQEDTKIDEKMQGGNGGKKLDKKMIAAFSMGGVIIVLLIVLIVLVAGNKNSSTETSSKDAQVAEESQDADVDTENGEETNIEGEDSDTLDEDSGDEDGADKDATDKENSDKETSDKENSDKGNSDKDMTDKDEALIALGMPLVRYDAANSWEEGSKKMSGVDFQVVNNSKETIKGWELILTINEPVSVDGWNGTYTIKGSTLVITNADYNGDIYPGGSIIASCNLGTKSELSVTKATLNGVECVVKKGSVNKNATNNPDGNNKNDKNSENGKNNEKVKIERPKKAVQGDDWLSVSGNKIVDKDGKEVWITGLNWFGYNTGTNTFDGLWTSELKSTVKAIADHGFNFIRVPISAELINQWSRGEYPQANYNHAYNEELNSMNSLEIFEYFLQLAEENGIKVMPDIHSAETDASGHNVNLWYTSRISVDDYYSALEWMAKRYKNNDTIIAYDLKNEPHGKPNEGQNAAIWNNSKDANNWKHVAETAASKVLAQNPNVLILVEGTEIYPKNNRGDYSSTDSGDYYFNWWGGNLRAVKDFPIDLGKYQNKLVYSPHDYGPTVYEQPWFAGDYTYSSLMRDCWKDNWFYIYENKIAPLHIGEWGGFMREPNLKWMTYLRQLIKTYKLNHTFWCLNANSGDTGGLLLDDFSTWDTEKYDFVKEVLWQKDGKFVGLDHAIALGTNGISLTSLSKSSTS